MCKYTSVATGYLVLFQIVATANVRVSELVDRYRETQDRLQQSFIIRFESTVSFSYKLGNSKRSGKKTELIELRFDGDRSALRRTLWGDVNSKTTDLPRNEALYKSYLWDGEHHTRYSKASLGKYADYVVRDKGFGNHNMAFRSSDKELMGFFSGDKERVDSILSKANRISVRDEMDTIGGAGCYVIDALTDHGKYALWIDPEHGYNVARAIVWKKDHHIYENNSPSKGHVSVQVLENVRFEKIDDIWVPVEADVKYNRKGSSGDFSDSELHVKRTEVVLNPDHDALGSFVPDDIPNGTRVRVVQTPGTSYFWLEGKPVLARPPKTVP